MMALEPDFATAVRSILDESTTLTLATVEADGSPRATPLFFAAEPDLSLLFLSDPASPHIHNLRRSPEVAASLHPAVAKWEEIRGLQLKGEVAAVSSEERETALEPYRQRFPFIEQLPEALAASILFRLSPSWIRLIDNRQGFGHKQEAHL